MKALIVAARIVAFTLAVIATVTRTTAEWLREWASPEDLALHGDEIFDRWEADGGTPVPPIMTVAGRKLIGEWRDAA